MKSLNSLIHQYRRQKKRMARSQQQISNLEKKMEDLNHEYFRQRDELCSTKDLIDWCINTGQSPAEAALKYTRQEIRQGGYNQDFLWLPVHNSASYCKIGSHSTDIVGSSATSSNLVHTTISGLNSLSGGKIV